MHSDNSGTLKNNITLNYWLTNHVYNNSTVCKQMSWLKKIIFKLCVYKSYVYKSYVYKSYGGAMVIVVGNGHGDTSSNPGSS